MRQGRFTYIKIGVNTETAGTWGIKCPRPVGLIAMAPRNAGRRRQDSRRNPEPAINGPTPEAVGEALDALTSGNPRETPPLSALKTLLDAGIEFPVTVGDRRVMEVSIALGRPRHGAMRSDDHVSRYEVEYARPCPENDCFSEVTRYAYRANHHIAGSERTYCPRCEAVHDSEEWG